jgi:hypothetical protein
MPPHEMTTTQLIISFFILLIIASLTAYYADRKGRSFTIWFILGVLLGVFAPLILFFLSSNNESNENNSPAMTVSKPDPSLQAAASLPAVEFKGNEDKLWYYLDKDHKQMGPVSIVALRDLWNRGLLELTTYVWSQGMNDWLKVEQLPELKAALNKENI